MTERKDKKPKILVIVGPTASGKSDLGVQLAKKYNGEIVSADSRQVYTGLDIGTGKITKDEMQGIPHHMLDVASPRQVYSVSEYASSAHNVVERILVRQHVPIVVGGTGFYIQALVDNIHFPDVPPNAKLRAQLALERTERLLEHLGELDPDRASQIDSKNRVRLIRAIEIASSLGSVPKATSSPLYDALYIGIFLEKEKLHERIHNRLLERLEHGMVEEVEKLQQGGLSYARMEELGLEYRYVARYLQGKLTKQAMTEELEQAIKKYAKRQMTWFLSNKQIQWFSPSQIPDALHAVDNFL